MELNKDSILKIFEKNFNYEIVDTLIGKAIKMNWYDAFLYCNVTGAGYLDNPVMPFTPKGMMKIFYNAFDYNFVTGIFENTSLRNTPINMKKIKPYLFKGDKYILLEEFNKEVELSARLNKYMEVLKANNRESTDYIIQRIETSKKGNGMESFMEYIACEVYKNNGYIVENQIPLTHDVGSPDFGGYSLKNVINYFLENKMLNSGFHIIELALLRIKQQANKVEGKEIELNNAIVGEAKTSTIIMKKQLEKYMSTGLYEYGIELHPDKKLPSKEEFALITFDSEYKISIKTPNIREKINNEKYDKEKYYEWLNNYMKFYLIANLYNDELNDFYIKKMKRKMSSTEDIVELLKKCTLDEIIEVIMGGNLICHPDYQVIKL